MTEFNAYVAVIATSLIIIFSYLFNLIASKTNIPSVLLLIILGLGMKYGAEALGIPVGDNLIPVLEILGIVGLTMIVLEAALDLELEADRWPIIWKSFLVALIALVATALAGAYINQ